MEHLLYLFLVLIVWGAVGLVPASLAGRRRKRKMPTYWLLLIAAVFIELIIALSGLQLSIRFEVSRVGVLFCPLVGAIFSGYLYWSMAEAKDGR